MLRRHRASRPPLPEASVSAAARAPLPMATRGALVDAPEAQLCALAALLALAAHARDGSEGGDGYDGGEGASAAVTSAAPARQIGGRGGGGGVGGRGGRRGTRGLWSRVWAEVWAAERALWTLEGAANGSQIAARVTPSGLPPHATVSASAPSSSASTSASSAASRTAQGGLAARAVAADVQANAAAAAEAAFKAVAAISGQSALMSELRQHANAGRALRERCRAHGRGRLDPRRRCQLRHTHAWLPRRRRQRSHVRHALARYLIAAITPTHNNHSPRRNGQSSPPEMEIAPDRAARPPTQFPPPPPPGHESAPPPIRAVDVIGGRLVVPFDDAPLAIADRALLLHPASLVSFEAADDSPCAAACRWTCARLHLALSAAGVPSERLPPSPAALRPLRPLAAAAASAAALPRPVAWRWVEAGWCGDPIVDGGYPNEDGGSPARYDAAQSSRAGVGRAADGYVPIGGGACAAASSSSFSSFSSSSPPPFVGPHWHASALYVSLLRRGVAMDDEERAVAQCESELLQLEAVCAEASRETLSGGIGAGGGLRGVFAGAGMVRDGGGGASGSSDAARTLLGITAVGGGGGGGGGVEEEGGESWTMLPQTVTELLQACSEVRARATRACLRSRLPMII